MKYTEKFGLKKPEENDAFDVENFNENMDIIDPLLVKDTGWIDFYNDGDIIQLYCRRIGAQVILKGTMRIIGGGHDTTAYESSLEAARLTELNLLPQYEFKVNNSTDDFISEIIINNNGVYLTGYPGQHTFNNISWVVD